MARTAQRKSFSPYAIRLRPEDVRGLERAAKDITATARQSTPHAAPTGPRSLAATVIRAWLSEHFSNGAEKEVARSGAA